LIEHQSDKKENKYISILEYAQKGDLHDLIINKGTAFDEILARFYFE